MARKRSEAVSDEIVSIVLSLDARAHRYRPNEWQLRYLALEISAA